MASPVKLSVALIAALLAALALAPAAPADEAAAKAEYTVRAEAICQANTRTSRRILAGAQRRVRAKKLGVAGGQFVRAAAAFGRATGRIASLPRPPAEEVRLGKWISHLRLVQGYLRTFGRALQRGERERANIAYVRLHDAANAANNVVYNFNFRYCRLTGARLR